MRKMFAALTVAAFIAALGAPAFAKESDCEGPDRGRVLL